MSLYDDLEKKFGIHDMDDEAPFELLVTDDKSNVVCSGGENKLPCPLAECVENDYMVARESMKRILELGNEALEKAVVEATEGGSARHFDAVSSLIKNLANANESMLTLHQKLMDMSDKSGGSAKPVVQNMTQTNNYIGSTQDLLNSLEDDPEIIESS